MHPILEALDARKSDIAAYQATEQDLDALSSILVGNRYAPIVEAYRTYPLSGMLVSFSIQSGKVAPPAWPSSGEFESSRDHEFDWLSPLQIIAELKNTLGGAAAFSNGYVPIGMCAMGGDWYFIKLSMESNPTISLHRIFYDYVSDTKVLSYKASERITDSFIEVIRVAELESPS